MGVCFVVGFDFGVGWFVIGGWVDLLFCLLFRLLSLVFMQVVGFMYGLWYVFMVFCFGVCGYNVCDFVLVVFVDGICYVWKENIYGIVYFVL